MKLNDTKIEPMTINLKNEMIKINELLLLHQKTKAILTKKIDALLIVLDTDEAKTKLQQQQPPMLVPFKAFTNYG